MKKYFLLLIVFLFNLYVYSYEPAHPYYCFVDYINQIENLINNNLEVTGSKSAYVIIEYSGDDSEKLDTSNNNIKKLYLIDNQKIEILPQDKKHNYKIIKKLIDKKGDYLYIPVVYFKIYNDNIYITLEEYNALVHYKVKLDLIKKDNKIQISNIPDYFDEYDYFKTGLTVYSNWYK